MDGGGKKKELLLATTSVPFALALWPNLSDCEPHALPQHSEWPCLGAQGAGASPAPAVEQLLPRGALCACRVSVLAVTEAQGSDIQPALPHQTMSVHPFPILLSISKGLNLVINFELED